jgi:site-specific DNA recombinase
MLLSVYTPGSVCGIGRDARPPSQPPIRHDDRITEAEVRDAFERLDPMWDELFPTEQARIVQLLVERVDVKVDGIAIRLRTGGLTKLLGELQTFPDRKDAA